MTLSPMAAQGGRCGRTRKPRRESGCRGRAGAGGSGVVSPPRSPAPGLLARCRIVLVRTQGPVNLGMVARLCGNLSITDLRLVSPLCEIDCEDARKFSTWGKELLLSAP